MTSDFWFVALVVSPFLIGWGAHQYPSWLSMMAGAAAAGAISALFLSFFESSVNVEYRSAIAPFDLNSNGILEELELNEEAQLAILDHPPVGKFDFVVLMPFTFTLSIVGVMIWPAFSYVYSTLSKPSSIRSEQLLHESCAKCSNELEYNTSLIGLEGICPNCKANITFPAPPSSDAR